MVGGAGESLIIIILWLGAAEDDTVPQSGNMFGDFI